MIIVYIMVGISGLAILFGAWRMIPWYEIFESIYGDNPAKAKIYILNDQHEKVVNGRFYWMDKDYLYYHYQLNDREATVRRPIAYKDIFLRGRLKLLVKYGDDIASPMYPEDVAVVKALSPFDLNERFKPYLGIAMVNALHSNKGLGIKGILIIVAILVVVFVGFMLWRGHNSAKPVLNVPVNSTNVTQANSSNLSQQDIQIIKNMQNGK